MASKPKTPKTQQNQDNCHEAYFAQLLPWQDKLWADMIGQFYNNRLPHATLLAGMSGIGKREFAWRLTAWLLCHHKPNEGACGDCTSCLWLKAGTHPNFYKLPKEDDSSIKIDDIREIGQFFATTGGTRVMLIDNADTMTIGAGNALLKTLEEPASDGFFILISDHPNRLMATIKSRTQALPMTQIDHAKSQAFVRQYIQALDNQILQADNLLRLADFAPIYAKNLPKMPWFDKREIWLKTLYALQNNTRSVVQAADFWQANLSVVDFMTLSKMMLAELWRYGLGTNRLHGDIDEVLIKRLDLNQDKLIRWEKALDDVAVSLGQNVQDKIAFESLLHAMAQ